MLASDYTDSHDFIPNLEKTFLAKTPRRKEIPLCVLASLREMSSQIQDVDQVLMIRTLRKILQPVAISPGWRPIYCRPRIA